MICVRCERVGASQKRIRIAADNSAAFLLLYKNINRQMHYPTQCNEKFVWQTYSENTKKKKARKHGFFVYLLYEKAENAARITVLFSERLQTFSENAIKDLQSAIHYL